MGSELSGQVCAFYRCPPRAPCVRTFFIVQDAAWQGRGRVRSRVACAWRGRERERMQRTPPRPAAPSRPPGGVWTCAAACGSGSKLGMTGPGTGVALVAVSTAGSGRLTAGRRCADDTGKAGSLPPVRAATAVGGTAAGGAWEVVAAGWRGALTSASLEEPSMILAICSEPSTIRTTAVTPINAPSLPARLVGLPAAEAISHTKRTREHSGRRTAQRVALRR